MAQSVVMKPSMVAMLGWIIPEPLAMAPMVTVFPPNSMLRASSFFIVSVVRMASRASIDPALESPATRASIPASIGVTSSCTPITPVEATTTSSALTGRRSATSAAMRRAAAIPASPLQVLALPELTITAWAWPSARCSLVTTRGWPITLLVV